MERMEGYARRRAGTSLPPSSPTSSSSGGSPASSPVQLPLHHPTQAELQQRMMMQQQIIMQHLYPPGGIPPAGFMTKPAAPSLLPRGVAPWSLPMLPPALETRPPPPAPPSSSSSSSSAQGQRLASSTVASVDVEATSSPPPSTQPSPRTPSRKQVQRSTGGRRERCGLCDEWWDREPKDGASCYPDREGVLVPKCPKCNKMSYGGLCYVVETESRQGEQPDKRGRVRAQSLPHVVYQPLVVTTPAQHLTDTFVNTIRRGKAVLAVFPGSTGDTNLGREYLLFSDKRSHIMEKVELMHGLEMLRDLFCEDRFFVLHYKYDHNALLVPCLVKKQTGTLAGNGECEILDRDEIDAVRSVEVSDIQIGLLIRRGTNKLYNQRVLGLNHQNTLNARLDVYVTKQALWDHMGSEQQSQLKYIQQLVEDEFLLLFKQWNLMGVQQEKEEAQAKASGSPSSSSSSSPSSSSSSSSSSSRQSPPQLVSSPPSPMTAAPSPSSFRRGDEPSSPVSSSADATSSPPSASSPPSSSSSSSSSPSSSSSSPYVQASPYGKKRRYYPLCLIGQRDVFRIQLIPVNTVMSLTWNGITRRVTKTQWYFPREREPENFNPRTYSYNPAAPPGDGAKSATKPKSAKSADDDYQADLDETPAEVDDDMIPQAKSRHGNVEVGYPVGVTTYTGFFTDAELRKIEEGADATDADARNGKYDEVPNTYQCTRKGDRLCRTKFFFSARYLWTAEQMSSPNSTQAQGIRADVAEPPFWMRQLIERPLVESKIVQEAWVNEFAMNIYHDGTEGLGQHYDDKKRFKRPIHTLRIFSDSRLAFGSKDFSMTNSVFFIPMPRGCITVLEKKGYAVDGIKHCVRAADLGGKSGVVLLRQIHPHLIKEAKQMQRNNSMTRWLASLDLEDPQQYVDAFIKEELDLVSVRYLHECDLKTLGMSKMGPRKIVLRAIYQLRERDGLVMPPHSCCCQCASEIHPGGTSQPALPATRATNAAAAAKQSSSSSSLADDEVMEQGSVQSRRRERSSSSSSSNRGTATTPTSSRSRSPGREKSSSKRDASATSSSALTKESATSSTIYATPPSHIRHRTTPHMGGRIRRRQVALPSGSDSESPATSPMSSPSLSSFLDVAGVPPPSAPLLNIPSSSFPSSSSSSSSFISSPPPSSSSSSSSSSSAMMTGPLPFLPVLPFFGAPLPAVSLMGTPSASGAGAATGKRPLPPSSEGVPFSVMPVLPMSPRPPSSPSSSSSSSSTSSSMMISTASTPPPAKRSKKKTKKTTNQSSSTSSSSSSASSLSSPSMASSMSTWKPSRPPLMPLQLQPFGGPNVANAANIYPADLFFMKAPPSSPAPMMMMAPPTAPSQSPPPPSSSSSSATKPAWSPARQLENQLLSSSAASAASAAAAFASPFGASSPPAGGVGVPVAPGQRALRMKPAA